ncbi:MAG TPA: bluetail domain-containing putative surface protein [Rhizomicrobium sp.]|nr:bluetail domain-containing putative surface protein [Rhizomicrobium sp.]
MTKLTVGSQPFDMTDWDLSDIANGSVTSSSATEVDVAGFGGVLAYEIKGSGFTTFDAHGLPTSGTVTSFVQQVPGHVATNIFSFSIPAATFSSFVESNDAAGLEGALFSGNDSLSGRTGDDVLLGYGGNDVFSETKGGNDTVQGGDGDDTVNFDAAFTAADSVDGGAGTDKVTLAGDYSAGVTFGAATMVNVETLVAKAGFDYDLVLNATSDTSGQSLAVIASALAAANHVTFDGSALAGTLRLVGGAGDDTLTGGSGANTFVGKDGNDTFVAGTGVNVIGGGNGNDTATFTNWVDGDNYQGNSGTNALILNGDFSGGVTLDKHDMSRIDSFTLGAGHDYDITLDTSAYHAGSHQILNLHFDASALGASDGFTLDWHPGDLNNVFITGGAGNDTVNLDFTGSSSGLLGQIDLSQGGDDTVIVSNFAAQYLEDAISVQYGATFNANDVVENAKILLDGDYSAGVTLNPLDATTVIGLTGGHSYSITIPSMSHLEEDVTIGGSQLQAGDSLYFDGSAVTESRLTIYADCGTSTIFGGSSLDTINVSTFGGTTTVHAGDGPDMISVKDFTASSFVDGGAGDDTLVITSSSSGPGSLSLGSAQIANIETLAIDDGNLSTTVTDNIVADGQTMIVEDGTASSPGQLRFDGSAETTGAFHIIGGAGGPNLLIGSAGNDNIEGGFSANFVTGGAGADQIVCGTHVDTLTYNGASDSTDANYDTVTGFDVSSDVFKLGFAVSTVDATVHSGTLSTASFDSDLAAAIGAGQLGVHHAVLFTPNAGTLSGDHFLVIDVNGTAGYQAGQDLVIELVSPTSLTLTTDNFIH